MWIKWTSSFTVTSIIVLLMNSPITRGESIDMNQGKYNIEQTSSNSQHKISDQTEREILDYWTPERIQNVKPTMPMIPEIPSSAPQSDFEEPSSPSTSAPGSDI